MTLALVVLIAVSVAALIGIPIRVLQLFRGKFQPIYESLGALGNIIVTIGLVLVVLGAVAWAGVAYVAVMILTDDPARRVWGGSEFWMVATVAGFLYISAELLLIPATIRQVRKRRAVSA